MKNIFKKEVTEEVLTRINSLKPDSKPKWGKMNVAQMLAHCNVTYEMVYDNKHEPAKGMKKFFLKLLIKGVVVSEKTYKPNGRTAPQFLIVDERVFDKEKQRLTDYVIKTLELGEHHFDGKDLNSFGELNKTEWNNMFYKHLDHHLNQFGL